MAKILQKECVSLVHLMRIVLAGFLHCGVTFFSVLYLRRGDLETAPRVFLKV